MSEIHKTRVLILLVIALAAALVLPVLFGAAPETPARMGENSWRNFIYDFQTLITGGLAIFAAYLTVNAAFQIDLRQQLRHEQILSFTVRRELRALERSLHPQLREITDIIERLWKDDFSFSDNESNSWTWFSTIAENYIGHVRELREIIERKQFTDGEPYFDGRLSRSHDNFKASLTRIESCMKNHLEALEEMSHGRSDGYYEFHWDEIDYFHVVAAENFLADAAAFRAELGRAGVEYEKMRVKFKH